MDFSDLPVEIQQTEICSWLDIRSLINLKCCSTQFLWISTKMAAKAIIAQIIRRLSQVFGDLWSDFRKELIRSRAKISGSFIIQCILGETWSSPSDIDIYVSHIDDMYINQHLIPYDKSTNLDSWFYKNLVTTGYDSVSYRGKSEPILRVRNFRFVKADYKDCFKNYAVIPYSTRYINYNVNEVQSIVLNLKQDEIEGYVQRAFDFDICKNVFWFGDGGVPHLQITNLRQILERRVELRKGQVKKIDYDRRIKYERRGFVFVDWGKYKLKQVK